MASSIQHCACQFATLAIYIHIYTFHQEGYGKLYLPLVHALQQLLSLVAVVVVAVIVVISLKKSFRVRTELNVRARAHTHARTHAHTQRQSDIKFNCCATHTYTYTQLQSDIKFNCCATNSYIAALNPFCDIQNGCAIYK